MGATKVSVLASVSRGMVLPVVFGLAAGVASARGLSRLVASFMFGVTSTDPLTYGLIAMSVLGVSVAATLGSREPGGGVAGGVTSRGDSRYAPRRPSLRP